MDIFRRARVGMAVLAALGLVVGAPAQAPATGAPIAEASAKVARQPNIVLILADDLGYADVGAYKAGRYQTPNIDKLAKQGVRFTAAYAAAPVCAPSRAGLLTGRYPQRFGFEFNQGPGKREFKQGYGLDAKELTIGNVLQTAGYKTGLVGKWHMGIADKFYPTNRGFDEFVGLLTAETSYGDPAQPGVRVWPQDRAAAVAATKDGVFHRWPHAKILDGPNRTLATDAKEYLTDYLTNRSVEFIERNAKSNKPYFLYAAYTAPHSPHMVVQKYYDRFPEIKDELQRINAAMIASLDDGVGQIMAAVEASGEADNTIVVFTSDNGCEDYFSGLCSCEPMRGGKLTHYEGGARVPMIVRWPGKLQAGALYSGITSLMDLLPTTVAAAGGHLPADRTYDGVNFLPFIAGKAPGQPHDVLIWRRAPLVSIRAGDWKLWEVSDKTRMAAQSPYGDYTLLFNLKVDENETTNVATQNVAKVNELRALITDWEKDKQPAAWPTAHNVTWPVCGKIFTVPI